MADDLRLDVNINVKNAGGGEIKRVAADAAKAFKGTAAEQRKVTSASAAQTSAIKRNAASQRAANNAMRAGSALAAAGLDEQKRAAQDAGNALDKTARSGKQAQQAMSGLGRVSMRSLNDGLGRAMQTMRNMIKSAAEMGKGIGQIGAGLAAAGMVGARALRDPIDFERNLTSLAITAYGGKNTTVEEFDAGYEKLRLGVYNATRIGGGKRDDAMAAANTLIASGVMDVDDIINMLPTIQKAATASGASSEEIAGIVVAAVQNGFSGTDATEIGKLLDAAVMGGKVGSAELKNMASNLPTLMAAYQGDKGHKGFANLIAAYETAMFTSGSADQAGTNLSAFLSKFNSPELSKAFAEKYGVDWTGTQQAFIEEGHSPVEAFLKTFDQKVLGENKDYQALQSKLREAGDDAERRAILEQMAGVLQASSLGEVISDIRGMRGAVAMLNGQDYWRETAATLTNDSAGTVEADHRFAMRTSGAKADQLELERQYAQGNMHSDVKGVLDGALDGLTSLAREFPRLTTLVTEAGTAFGAMLAGGAAWGGLGMVLGRRGGKGVAGRAGAAGLAGAAAGVVPVYVTNINALAAGGAGGANAAGAAPLGRGAQVARFMRGAAPLAVGFGLFNAVNLAMDDTMNLRENTAAQVGNVGGTMGALGGAAFGAAMGSALAPGIGTVLGGVLGGILGNFIGEETMSRLAEGQGQAIELQLKSTLQLDGKEIYEDVVQRVLVDQFRWGM